jgi:integrase
MKQLRETTKTPGVYKVHARGCTGGRCRCTKSYLVRVYSPREQTTKNKTFDNYDEAVSWRGDVRTALKQGKTTARATKDTLELAAAQLIEGMRAGAIRNRSGRRYKPSAIGKYERDLRNHVLPELGHRPYAKIERRELQRLVEKLLGDGMADSTARNVLDPVQVIYRRALDDGIVSVDPTEGLRLPAKNRRRERVADRAEAGSLIAALPKPEQALWACAFYGGLRRGELQALRWSDIDLASEPGRIHVTRAWDDENKVEVETKTEAGVRAVPLTGGLRELLAQHGLDTGRTGDDLVFGRTADQPFVPTTIRARALKAWKAAGLERVVLHEARHTFASFLIDAQVNPLALTKMIGHTDHRFTMRQYGHLFPDSDEIAAGQLDAYLSAS